MSMHDPVELIAGVPLIVITPALVELAKRLGVPVRFAGLVAMGAAMTLLAGADLATGAVPSGGEIVPAVARWAIGGVVYGLAAAGLYSQVRVIEEGGFDEGR